MSTVTNFDEINKIVGYKRSVPYDKYFAPMGLPKSRQNERKKLAERFEDSFLMLFYLMLIMRKTNVFDKVQLRQQFVNAYFDVLQNSGDKTITAHSGDKYDSEMVAYVGNLADSFIDATVKNKSNDYFFSEDRLMLFSENEANTVYNHFDNAEAEQNGYTKKMWMTMQDNRVRDSHVKMQGETVGINELFSNGMPYPKAIGFPPEETVGCRCWLKYLKD